MNKAFTKESDAGGDEQDHLAEEAAHAPLVGVKNYITPSGLQRLKDERRFLLTRERPAVTKVVAWAATLRSQRNADYQYGTRRLREIDRRIRFLPTNRCSGSFGPESPRSGRTATRSSSATVRYANASGTERGVSVVASTRSIWTATTHLLSPLARALMKSGPGDSVVLHAPGTTEQLEIREVRYERIPIEPFTEPPGAESAPKTDPQTGR